MGKCFIMSCKNKLCMWYPIKWVLSQEMKIPHAGYVESNKRRSHMRDLYKIKKEDPTCGAKKEYEINNCVGLGFIFCFNSLTFILFMAVDKIGLVRPHQTVSSVWYAIVVWVCLEFTKSSLKGSTYFTEEQLHPLRHCTTSVLALAALYDNESDRGDQPELNNTQKDYWKERWKIPQKMMNCRWIIPPIQDEV